jgi:hypothetical protein
VQSLEPVLCLEDELYRRRQFVIIETKATMLADRR